MILKTGDALDEGRYIIQGMLGKGGMGEVYLAHQASVDREVAIKVLHPRLTHEDVIKRRFHREAKLMAKLNHPHCVTVYDFGETSDGLLYIVMERLKGQTLADLLILRGSLSLSETLSIVRQVALALRRAHELSCVHRDLKPENIYLTPHAEADLREELEEGGSKRSEERDTLSSAFHVKVIDFGIAKVLAHAHDDEDDAGEHARLSERYSTVDLSSAGETLGGTLSETLDETIGAEGQAQIRGDASEETRGEGDDASNDEIRDVSDVRDEIERRRAARSIYTQEHIVIGTPLYMSPEHMKQSTLDHRSDIYALGLIWYECLAGHTAFTGDSVTDLLMAHARQPAPQLIEVRPELPETVSDLIDACLVKSKELRLSDASLVLHSVDAFAQGEELPSKVSSLLSRIRAGRATRSRRDRGTVENSSGLNSSLWRLIALCAVASFFVGAISVYLWVRSSYERIPNQPTASTRSDQISDQRSVSSSNTGQETTNVETSVLPQKSEPPKSADHEEWLTYYTPEGEIKWADDTTLMWSFDHDLSVKSARAPRPVKPSQEPGGSYIKRHWRARVQPRDRFLRGVLFKEPDRWQVQWETSARLSKTFTIELWVYLYERLLPQRTSSRCARPILSTFHISNTMPHPRDCLYTEAYLASGGWGLLARTFEDHVELDLSTFGFSSHDTPTPQLSVRAAPGYLSYRRWNHIVAISDRDQLSWVINGKIHQQAPLSYLAERDTHSPSPTLGSLIRAERVIHMRIDDVRISETAHDPEWAKRAYHERSSRQTARDPSGLYDPPPAQVSY